ncbi:hypothetical protein [Parvularcula sp. LCG005]|uniref:hypothetical protein n=1 Tax=Parvularcula sp. LCG005 TaxID=3078805 RepID=UPI002942F8C6|nr:hypothetical protein [Parvularcula sp. LCG005]WOI52016.1 hypothetical protein RUI03_07585 [Parvularcula sp. LCG005]
MARQKELSPEEAAVRLRQIEYEVRDALHVAYASAYWELAGRIREFPPDLIRQFWDAAERELNKLPADLKNLSEVLEVLDRQRDGEIVYLHSLPGNWLLQPRVYKAVDVLKAPTLGVDRRQCRSVAAILFDRGIKAAERLKVSPDEENYWDWKVTTKAMSNAALACPGSEFSGEPLLRKLIKAGLDLDSIDAPDLKPQYQPPPSKHSAPPTAGQPPLVTFDIRPVGPPKAKRTLTSLSQERDVLVKRVIEYWDRGPDGLIRRKWNRIVEYWETR